MLLSGATIIHSNGQNCRITTDCFYQYCHQHSNYRGSVRFEVLVLSSKLLQLLTTRLHKGDVSALLNPSFIDRSEMSAHRSYSQTKPSQVIPTIREEVLAVRELPVLVLYSKLIVLVGWLPEDYSICHELAAESRLSICRVLKVETHGSGLFNAVFGGWCGRPSVGHSEVMPWCDTFIAMLTIVSSVILPKVPMHIPFFKTWFKNSQGVALVSPRFVSFPSFLALQISNDPLLSLSHSLTRFTITRNRKIKVWVHQSQSLQESLTSFFLFLLKVTPENRSSRAMSVNSLLN